MESSGCRWAAGHDRFGRTEADSALRAACEAIGIDAAGAKLLRIGENALYRLATVPLVARVARTADYLEAARKEIAVSAWLAAAGLSVVRVADEIKDQPIVASGYPITFWRWLERGDDYGTPAELGALLRSLHALIPPGDLPLPAVEPFGRTYRRVRTAADLPEDDRQFLLESIVTLGSAYERLEFVLPAGPVHGDADTGNVVHDGDGMAVLIDLDMFAVGPREWDLVLTAMYADSFGWVSEAEYAEFVGIYGYDVRSWSGYPVLRAVREVMMVAWLAQNIGENPAAAAEYEKRISALRTGRSRRDWSPF